MVLIALDLQRTRCAWVPFLGFQRVEAVMQQVSKQTLYVSLHAGSSPTFLPLIYQTVLSETIHGQEAACTGCCP